MKLSNDEWEIIQSEVEQAIDENLGSVLLNHHNYNATIPKYDNARQIADEIDQLELIYKGKPGQKANKRFIRLEKDCPMAENKALLRKASVLSKKAGSALFGIEKERISFNYVDHLNFGQSRPVRFGVKIDGSFDQVFYYKQKDWNRILGLELANILLPQGNHLYKASNEAIIEREVPGLMQDDLETLLGENVHLEDNKTFKRERAKAVLRGIFIGNTDILAPLFYEKQDPFNINYKPYAYFMRKSNYLVDPQTLSCTIFDHDHLIPIPEDEEPLFMHFLRNKSDLSHSDLVELGCEVFDEIRGSLTLNFVRFYEIMNALSKTHDIVAKISRNGRYLTSNQVRLLNVEDLLSNNYIHLMGGSNENN